MKLPIAWLMDYLPEQQQGAAFDEALAAACHRWDLESSGDAARSLAHLLTFAGFSCDGIEGAGATAILELDVTSNRPDGQCIVGLAREVAAILQTPLRQPASDLIGKEHGQSADSLAQVTIEDTELCPRYTARIIRGVKVGPSPQWLSDRLTWIGLQPRNNIVDITNFICFELNQPLHAFDLNLLEGRQIIVRRARDKEPFTPLYEQVPPLTSETLMIADARNARAIAGILGGKGSEVTSETTDILLEAAYFNPAYIRRAVRRLKIMDGRGTDSSYRFERGIDLDRVAQASARAARLFVEVAGGTIAPGIIDVYPRKRAPKILALRFAELARVFGAPVPNDAVCNILQSLGCLIVASEPSQITVSIPSWRRGDLEREIDLIEEVARIYGYNHVPDTTAMNTRVPPSSPLESACDHLRSLFTALGYFETISDSLIDPKWRAPDVWTRESPLLLDKASVLREDHSALRNSLLVSLLAARRYNQDHRAGEARLFEIGKVFLTSASLLEERHSLCLIDDRGFQILADAIAQINDALEFDGARLKLAAPTKTAPEFLQNGMALQVLCERNTSPNARDEDALGWLGVLSSQLQQAFDLRKPVAICELDLTALAALPTAPRRFKPLPAFPEIIRDLALIVDESVTWSQLETFARNWATHDELRDQNELPRFLSVFRGKQIGAGKKSVAFSVLYRASDRTLTDEEVNAAQQKFQQALIEQFKAVLR